MELAAELPYGSCVAYFAGMQNARVMDLGDSHPGSREKPLRESMVRMSVGSLRVDYT